MEHWKGNRDPSNPQEAYYVGLMNACGYRTKDLYKPVIGIVSSYTDVNPGHRPFRELAGFVKEGIWAAGGSPAEVNGPAPWRGRGFRPAKHGAGGGEAPPGPSWPHLTETNKKGT